MCRITFPDEHQLWVHFEEKQCQAREKDPAIVQNIKELYGKAKKKIVQQEEIFEESDNATEDFSNELYGLEPSAFHPVSGIHYELIHESDNKIALSDKFDQFRLERDKRVDIRAKDINKYIVRLERLLTDLPSDPVKRRNHEQSVVPWTNEKDVPRCPSCGKGFSITRRKHHCRLCGYVMCEDCSDRVSFDLAKRLINPATLKKFNQVDKDGGELQKISGQGAKSKAQATYDGLVSNLVEFAGFTESQSNFRSCRLCKEVLSQQDQRSLNKTAPDPNLVKYYSHFRKLMNEGELMSEKYRSLSESLQDGQSTCNIEDLKVLQAQVEKIAKSVEVVSAKIENLDTKDDKTARLQQRIRSSAKNFIKDTFVGLPKVPTEEELKQIKMQKAQEATRRIEEEKKSAQEAKLKSASMKKAKQFNNDVQNKISIAKKQLFKTGGKNELKMGSGFVATASITNQEDLDEDPLGQQINNVKMFIREAKVAGKYDDARSLEMNLKLLQEEYRKLKNNEQQELVQNYEEFKDLFGKSEDELNQSNPFHESSQDDPEDSSKNPFDIEEEDNLAEDDYDKSGKNPFAE